MILIMGQAGAGKSVQGEALVESQGYTWLSAGVLLRARLNDPDLRERMAEGELLDDAMVWEIMIEAIESVEDPTKIILDGYPRSPEQADWLLDYLHQHDIPLSGVLLIDIDFDEALERLLKRGRQDDREEVIKHRFEEYQEVTVPIINRLQEEGVPVHLIEGHGSVEEVHKRVLEALNLT